MSEGQPPPLDEPITPVPSLPPVTHFDTHELRAAVCDYVQRCDEDQLLALFRFVSVAPQAELMLQNLDFFSGEHRKDR
jgi:hypothetical protein